MYNNFIAKINFLSYQIEEANHQAREKKEKDRLLLQQRVKQDNQVYFSKLPCTIYLFYSTQLF